MISVQMLQHLPGPVQLWLKNSGIIGKERFKTVQLTQTGQMMTKPGGNRMTFKARQSITNDPPAFIWKARIFPSPLLFISGTDTYEQGRGNMLIKIYGILPVVNAKGSEIDQGAMLRWLAEICWCPSSALSEHIHWEQLDTLSAKATISYGGITDSGVFYFAPNGDLICFETNRYYMTGRKKPSLEKWIVKTKPGAYREFEGIRIPYKSEVTWKLKEGDFTWLEMEITHVDYDNNLKRFRDESKKI